MVSEKQVTHLWDVGTWSQRSRSLTYGRKVHGLREAGHSPMGRRYMVSEKQVTHLREEGTWSRRRRSLTYGRKVHGLREAGQDQLEYLSPVLVVCQVGGGRVSEPYPDLPDVLATVQRLNVLRILLHQTDYRNNSTSQYSIAVRIKDHNHVPRVLTMIGHNMELSKLRLTVNDGGQHVVGKATTLKKNYAYATDVTYSETGPQLCIHSRAQISWCRPQ